ncbi:hypothetical protein [Streptomyces sp. SAJ15]|uniref:hypothetical protein n=1 Tax=Streptomyces sp. SAJ15 TaxID=2011095 RepID=UPI0011851494|nr:hypothetical protein [Streptomyces sp. SAJ15]TVL90782.1 hypothetical protein CD790_19570 [Streptomyces sp. SAJ15]
MADTQQPAATDDQPTASDRRVEKQAQRLAHQITAFAQSHGGKADGQLAHIGRGATRIALVGADGEWGNLVARSYQTAQRAVELSGITLQDDFDGELAARVRTGRYEWTRMAGQQIGGPSNG